MRMGFYRSRRILMAKNTGVEYELLVKEIFEQILKYNLANHGDTAILVSGSKWQGRWQENSVRIVVMH